MWLLYTKIIQKPLINLNIINETESSVAFRERLILFSQTTAIFKSNGNIMSYEESKSKLTFGNILMGLLLLSAVVVIGLIVLVYFKLTSPSERKVNMSPNAVSAPAPKVEKITPNGQPVANIQADPSQSQAAPNQASAAAARKKDADDAVNSMAADSKEEKGFNARALGAATGAQPAQKRVRPRTQRTQQNADGSATNNTRSTRRAATEQEETPLAPTNRAERRLNPTNSERTLTPTNQARNTNRAAPAQPKQEERPINFKPRQQPQGERELKPTNKPAHKQSGDLDALF